MKTSIHLESTFFNFHKNLVKIVLVLVIVLFGIGLFYHFGLHSQTLEETINDQKIYKWKQKIMIL